MDVLRRSRWLGWKVCGFCCDLCYDFILFFIFCFLFFVFILLIQKLQRNFKRQQNKTKRLLSSPIVFYMKRESPEKAVLHGITKKFYLFSETKNELLLF